MGGFLSKALDGMHVSKQMMYITNTAYMNQLFNSIT